ncbi:MAG TPA: hypothetical protein VEM40_07440 [Nitrospirota bacterium]|nr:hypothetical protein [Nitrospirota bacterium]
MKKECAYTRKSLQKYLHGHLFMPEQIRIERHLRSCVMCYTEFQALKQAAEAKQYLKDITPPEGVVQRVKAGVSGLSKLKKILYRPLWMTGIIAVLVLVYIYAVTPPRRDLEIENLQKPDSADSAPSSTSPAVSPDQTALAPVTNETTTIKAPASRPNQVVRHLEPLQVSMTVTNEEAAIQKINEAMRGYRELGKKRFSGSVREISGSLNSRELLSFFSQIESEGKIGYSRTRLNAFPSDQPVPFVMILKVASPVAERPSQPAQPAASPAEAASSTEPASAPTQSPSP